MFEVYIHVPFCLRRCGYCDFNTYTATDLGAGASRGNYANMVIREMKLTKQWQLDHGIAEPPVSTVFFGGGTPTILAARDLVAMLDAIRKIWGIAPDAEITTEANPDTVNEYYINELAAGGFTRVSSVCSPPYHMCSKPSTARIRRPTWPQALMPPIRPACAPAWI